MARPIYWAFAALLAAGAPAAGAAELCDAAQQRAGQVPPTKAEQGKTDKGQPPQNREGHRPRWWSDPKSRADFAITDQQSAAVEKIWQKNIETLRDTRAKLERLEEELALLTNANNADESAVIAKIEAVENMRADGNKRRTLMIYRMLKVLTPEQRVKVKALFEQPREPQRRFPSTSR